MTAEIHHIAGPTTAPHEPDTILERAKGQGFDDVMVIGFKADGPLWLSMSTSDVERVVFMLEWAKQKLLADVEAREAGG